MLIIGLTQFIANADRRFGKVTNHIDKFAGVDFGYAIHVGKHDFGLTRGIALDGKATTSRVGWNKVVKHGKKRASVE